MPHLDEDMEPEDADDTPESGEPEEFEMDNLLAEFDKDNVPPSSVTDIMERFDEWREYVHTDAMLTDTEDAVATNYILRNQYALLSLVVPEDPKPKLRPSRQVFGDNEYPNWMTDYAQTHEVLLDKQQARANLMNVLSGGVQDSFTVGAMILKARWQEDYTKDALGYERENDTLDTIARFNYLETIISDRDLADDSAEAQERDAMKDRITAARVAELMEDLESDPPDDSAGVDIADILESESDDERLVELKSLLDEDGDVDLPEVTHARGWGITQVNPEDWRYDWQITRPEDLGHCRWQSHRVWMEDEEIQAKWQLDDDEMRDKVAAGQLFSADGKPVTTTENTSGLEGRSDRVNSDDEVVADKINRRAVWERYDKVLGKWITWVQGAKDALAIRSDIATGARFFPLFIFIPNRATGRVFGVANTEMEMPIQDEINRLRTLDNEARDAIHPRYIIRTGTFNDAEKEAIEDARPFQTIETEYAGPITDVIQELQPSTGYNAMLYDTSKALLDLQAMSGLPTAALGATGSAKLATEAAIANEQIGVQADARRRRLEILLAEIYTYMAEVNAQVLSEEEVMEMVGPGAIWPVADRQQIFSNFTLEIEATLNDAQEAKQRLDRWGLVINMAAQLGIAPNSVEIFKQMLQDMGFRVDLDRFFGIPGVSGPVPGGEASEGSGPTPPGNAPEAQGAQGAGGGSPPIAERGVPSPEQVPNSPSAAINQ